MQPALDLDALAGRSFDELAALYAGAVSSRSLREIDGAPKGRMLAVLGLGRTPLGRAVRAFAASRAFVWDGKTFTSISDQEGHGINRVQIPGALGRQRLFPFETRFGASLVDGRDALILDYDLPENPPWIRKIHDEVRLVEPGLFLGPAMWKDGRGGARTLLWFALDARVA
ncbi:MAG: hypothetical protein IT374_03900 [Polyangiaceae bacterium]|nr:hypothetical protein [Polyangiaceae bacterium]